MAFLFRLWNHLSSGSILWTCLNLPVYLFQELVAQRVGHSVFGWRSVPVQARETMVSLLLFQKTRPASSVDVTITKWGKRDGNVALFSGLLNECISAWVHYQNMSLWLPPENEVWGKVTFWQVSVCPQGEGVRLTETPWTENPWKETPWTETE